MTELRSKKRMSATNDVDRVCRRGAAIIGPSLKQDFSTEKNERVQADSQKRSYDKDEADGSSNTKKTMMFKERECKSDEYNMIATNKDYAQSFLDDDNCEQVGELEFCCKTNWSPLHKAALLGKIETVKDLIESGADVNIEINGFTPLHLTKKTKIFGLLYQAGADPFIKTPNGEEILDIAKREGNTDLVEYIESLYPPKGTLKFKAWIKSEGYEFRHHFPSLTKKRQKDSATIELGRTCLSKSIFYQDRTPSMKLNMLYGICGQEKYDLALHLYLTDLYTKIKEFTTKGIINEDDSPYTKRIETFANDLKTFILRAPPLSHDIKVFSMQNKDKAIEDFSKQFISTNIGEHCISWDDAENNCYCITVPKGTPCLIICNGYEKENELLLPWGTRFVKTGKYEYKDKGNPPHPRSNAVGASGDRTVFELKAIAEVGINLNTTYEDVLEMQDWLALQEILKKSSSQDYAKSTHKIA